MEKKNYLLIVLVAILFLTIGGVVTYVIINNNNDKEPIIDNNNNNESSIMDSEWTGKVVVAGYPKISTSRWFDGNEWYSYVYFQLVEFPDDEQFLKWIESSQGNKFISYNGIGIGCIENNIITFDNLSDKIGWRTGSLNINDTTRILNATESNPIKLELEKLKITDGGHASQCYSHMTYIKVVN